MTWCCDQCSAAAVVFVPGDAEQRWQATLLLRGIPLRCLCLVHATEAGWPWITSEQPKRKARAA